LTQRLAVAKIPRRQSVDSGCNLGLCAGIRQSRQPIVEDIFSGAADVMTNLDHVSIVTYKSQNGKSAFSGVFTRRLGSFGRQLDGKENGLRVESPKPFVLK
jgi:hypothetical protein